MIEDIYTLWFSHFVNLSLKQKHAVVERFGDTRSIFYATRSELLDMLANFEQQDYYFNANTIRNIVHTICSDRNLTRAEDYAKKLDSKQIRLITLQDKIYPELLRHIPDPPLCLYMLGEMPDDSHSRLSVVGTRNCSGYGKVMTERICEPLAALGIVLVSGMAIGIDAHAAKSAIKAGGKTIAVLGCGVDICYPPENDQLRDQIIQNGCLLSEYPPGTPPHRYNFPQRNRIISGISPATLVIEAPLGSGAMITADIALDQGREVLSVMGNATSKESGGTNELIKQGSFPVTNAADVLAALDWVTVEYNQNKKKIFTFKHTNRIKIQTNDFNKSGDRIKTDETHSAAMNRLDEDEKKIYDILNNKPAAIDELIELTDFPVQKLICLLAKMEMNKLVKHMHGQKYEKL